MFSCSVMSNPVNPRTAACRLLCPSFAQTHDHELLMPSNHLIHCCPLLLLPSIFPSFRVFSNELAFFTSDGQNIGASASSWVLPKNTQVWFPLELTCLNSLHSIYSSPAVQKHQFLDAHPSLWCNSHIHIWLLENQYLLLYRPLSTKWCLCFVIRCLFVIAFLPKSKYVLISWLQ